MDARIWIFHKLQLQFTRIVVFVHLSICVSNVDLNDSMVSISILAPTLLFFLRTTALGGDI